MKFPPLPFPSILNYSAHIFEANEIGFFSLELRCIKNSKNRNFSMKATSGAFVKIGNYFFFSLQFNSVRVKKVFEQFCLIEIHENVNGEKIELEKKLLYASFSCYYWKSLPRFEKSK